MTKVLYVKMKLSGEIPVAHWGSGAGDRGSGDWPFDLRGLTVELTFTQPPRAIPALRLRNLFLVSSPLCHFLPDLRGPGNMQLMELKLKMFRSHSH